MRALKSQVLSRRHFCFCCLAGAALSRLAPNEAFAEARGLVSMIKDSAAESPLPRTSCAAVSVCLKGRAETSLFSLARMARC
jgi:hypothetical protein